MSGDFPSAFRLAIAQYDSNRCDPDRFTHKLLRAIGMLDRSGIRTTVASETALGEGFVDLSATSSRMPSSGHVAFAAKHDSLTHVLTFSSTKALVAFVGYRRDSCTLLQHRTLLASRNSRAAMQRRGASFPKHKRLAAACSLGDLSALEQELVAGANPLISCYVPSHDYNGALRSAARNGHVAIVKRLLADRRVDPNGHPPDLQPAIAAAAERGHVAVVDALLSDPRTDPSLKGDLALRHAASEGHAAVVERLLAHPRVDPSTDDNIALCLALRRGHVEAADRLLSHPRADANAHPFFLPAPIVMATGLDAGRLVDKLFAAGCSRVEDVHEAIQMAMRRKKEQALERLMSSHLAAAMADSEVLEWAVTRATNIGVLSAVLAASKFDSTAVWVALRAALQKGNTAAAMRLLDDPHVDAVFDTEAVLRTAAREGNTAVVSRLLAHPRVDPAAEHNSALRAACEDGQAAAAEALLADPRVDPAAYRKQVCVAIHPPSLWDYSDDDRYEYEYHLESDIKAAVEGAHSRARAVMAALPTYLRLCIAERHPVHESGQGSYRHVAPAAVAAAVVAAAWRRRRAALLARLSAR